MQNRRRVGAVAKPLPSATPASLVLFVAGEPELVPGVRETGVGPGRFRAGSVLLAVGVLPRTLEDGYRASLREPETFEPPPLTDHRKWHLPAPQMFCLDLVLRSAERQRKTVLVVDVNRPEEHSDLVERLVRPSESLPLLVRPDGARLDGEENFSAARVRRFIAGK